MEIFSLRTELGWEGAVSVTDEFSAWSDNGSLFMRYKIRLVVFGGPKFDGEKMTPVAHGDGGSLEYSQSFWIPGSPVEMRFRFAAQSGGLNCRPATFYSRAPGNTRMSLAADRFFDHWDLVSNGWSNDVRFPLCNGNYATDIHSPNCPS